MSSSTLSVVSFGGVSLPDESTIPNYAQLCNELQHGIEDINNVTLQHLTKTVLKAKRIAVVCGQSVSLNSLAHSLNFCLAGAGISCASGIPDFRSSEGLFQSLKKQHPQARLVSGKDLFDASLFQSEQNAAIFYTMIAQLKKMSDEAKPTQFHQFLKGLDEEGKLFRVYTQ